MTKDLTPIGQFGFFICDIKISYGATMPGKWVRRPQGAASAVFVHGILSSGEACWLNDNRSYWPELLKSEPELGSLGIYVFTYETGIFSGSYRLGDIVDDLKENMRVDGVLESNWLSSSATAWAASSLKSTLSSDRPN